MKFVELLNLILSFGPKIPQAMEIVERIVASLQELYDLFQPGVFGGTAPAELTDEETGLEHQILAACPQKETFAGPFQSIFAFIKAHPELISLLLSLLKK